jgi:AcrR family transcriptional regulator
VANAQRTRMVAAMISLAAEQGIAAATVTNVVSRAGVSRRTFYEVFGDIQDCLLAAVDAAIEGATEYLLERYDSEQPWKARMRAALEALLCFLEERPAMGRLLVLETLAAGPRALEHRRKALAPLIAAVDEGRLAARNGAAIPALAAEGVVGAVLSIVHARMLDGDTTPLTELVNSLMSMIVLPYLGAAAARAELSRPPAQRVAPKRTARSPDDPLKDLPMRITYRTMRVLGAIAAEPASSNRSIARAAGIEDAGQASKLLARLERLGLIVNVGRGQSPGAANEWRLTPKGAQVQRATGSPPEPER